MMLGFTYFWRALVWFVCFDFFTLGHRGQDERRWILGADGCASGNVGVLAAHSRQGSRVRPFVFMTNLPATEKTRVKSEVVLAQQATCTIIIFYSTQVCAGQHLDGPARRRLISLVFRPPVRNDMVSCVDFDWRQRGSDDDDDDVLIAGYSVSSIDVGGVNLLIALTFGVLFTVTRSTISRN